MTTVILFVLGAIVGSFLNVAAFRFRSGLSVGGRSRCGSCGKTLSWYELVPVVSFIVLGGRCGSCRANISWRYPAVETLTALIFATVYHPAHLLWVNALFLIIFSIYIVILIYDMRHKVIPNSLVYPAILLALVIAVLARGTLLDWLAGPILFAFFTLIWLLSRGRAMGFGDGKLALSIGLMLGAAGGFSAVIVAFWVGALYGLALIAAGFLSPLLTRGKRITMKSEVPFAPFLVLGAWLSLILQLDLLHVAFH